MTVDLRDILVSRADAVTPPDPQPQELVALGERAVRRRRRLAVAGGAAAVALVLGTIAGVSLVGDRATTPPTDQPRPAPASGSVPLTYGDGQTLHLGDLRLDTGLNFLSIDVGTAGAVLTTLDGGIWFSDGRTIDRVGSTLGGEAKENSVSWAHARPRDWVVTDAAGSTLFAWLEYPGDPRDPELVVYDGAARSVALRQPVDIHRRREAQVVSLIGTDVYLMHSSSGGVEVGDVRVRISGDGTQTEVSEAAYDEARRGRPRSLLVGDVDGHILTGYTSDHQVQLEVNGTVVTGPGGRQLLDPVSGEPVVLELPDGTTSTSAFLIQWLDDDRLVAMTGTMSPILVCDLGSGRCEVEIPAVSSMQDALLLPGHGLVGGELAMIAAMQE